MRMKFSVIIPIYNIEKYLPACLDSLVKQQYESVEYILVNDGSIDTCPIICDTYKKLDSRIKVIHKENGGLVSARKAGSNIAKGDYIINVDGDDWVEENFLTSIDSIINTYDNPDIVCFGAKYVKNEKYKNHTYTMKDGLYNKCQIRKIIYPMLIEDKFGHCFSPSIWSKAIKRNLYLQCIENVNNAIKIGEDHACTKPAVFLANNLYIMNRCIYNYRLNDESMTKVRNPFSWKSPELIGKCFEEQMDSIEDFREQLNRHVNHNLFNVAYTQFYSGLPYKSVKEDILKNLNNPYYKNKIENCVYSKKNIKGVFANFTLKHRIILLLYLYSKI